MSSTTAVARIDSSKIRPAAKVLVSALVDDPLTCYLFPDPSRRLALSDLTFRTHLNYGCLYGEVHSTSNLDGVAIWLPPGNTSQTPWRLFRAGTFALLPRFTPKIITRLMHYMDRADKAHALYAPQDHWYLYFLGVEPGRQGKGIGTQLLEPILKRADKQQHPCYLETTAERNLQFYTKHGFKVMDEVTLPDDGPKMWFLLRE